jgi:hypothetical protein
MGVDERRGPTSGVVEEVELPEARPALGARSGGRLSRAAWHFIVDVSLLLGLLTLLAASAVLQFVFPPPTEAAGWALWGWGYTRWSDIRFVSLCVFVLTTVVHLMLQWNWVCNFVVSRVSWLLRRKVTVAPAVRTVYGVALLITILTLLGTLLVVAEFTVRAPLRPGP